MESDSIEPLLTPRELAQRLHMSLKWVETHTQERRIPGQIKVGRFWRYDWLEVRRRMFSGQVLLKSRQDKSAQ
jgi:hypothetical protein